jgi:histidine triad (HIT) family protein
MRLSRLSRSRVARVVIGQVFAHMSFAIPVQRLRETPTLLAFHHPRPSYPVHILLVPKKALADLAALTPADADFMVDLFATAQSLVTEFGLEPGGYRLITNGGPYQVVPQLHFHLIADSAAPRLPPNR